SAKSVKTSNTTVRFTDDHIAIFVSFLEDKENYKQLYDHSKSSNAKATTKESGFDALAKYFVSEVEKDKALRWNIDLGLVDGPFVRTRYESFHKRYIDYLTSKRKTGDGTHSDKAPTKRETRRLALFKRMDEVFSKSPRHDPPVVRNGILPPLSKSRPNSCPTLPVHLRNNGFEGLNDENNEIEERNEDEPEIEPYDTDHLELQEQEADKPMDAPQLPKSAAIASPSTAEPRIPRRSNIRATISTVSSKGGDTTVVSGRFGKSLDRQLAERKANIENKWNEHVAREREFREQALAQHQEKLKTDQEQVRLQKEQNEMLKTQVQKQNEMMTMLLEQNTSLKATNAMIADALVTITNILQK
ncbi:hypothetical protein BGX20_006004, partial [Mortierella sp. AD010]